MNVGDKVWVEAVVTNIGPDTIDVAVQVVPGHQRVTHARTYKDAVRLIPGRKKAEAA